MPGGLGEGHKKPLHPFPPSAYFHLSSQCSWVLLICMMDVLYQNAILTRTQNQHFFNVQWILICIWKSEIWHDIIHTGKWQASQIEMLQAGASILPWAKIQRKIGKTSSVSFLLVSASKGQSLEKAWHGKCHKLYTRRPLDSWASTAQKWRWVGWSFSASDLWLLLRPRLRWPHSVTGSRFSFSETALLWHWKAAQTWVSLSSHQRAPAQVECWCSDLCLCLFLFVRQHKTCQFTGVRQEQ